MITARVRREPQAPVNRKKIHRILKLNGWQVRQRPQGQRPRVQGWVSRAEPAERALGDRHHASLLRPRRLVPPDGDHRLLRPHDRRLAACRGPGIAGVAAAALEEALRARQIDAHDAAARAALGQRPRLRRQGLRGGGAALRADQEYITPYTPQQNGMIERFFLTLKQECVWLHRFESRDHAFRVVARLARSLRHRPAALGPGLSHAEGVSRAISGLSCTKPRGTPQFVGREPAHARVVHRERLHVSSRVHVEQVPRDGLRQHGLQDGEFAIDGGRRDDLPASCLRTLDAEG